GGAVKQGRQSGQGLANHNAAGLVTACVPTHPIWDDNQCDFVALVAIGPAHLLDEKAVFVATANHAARRAAGNLQPANSGGRGWNGTRRTSREWPTTLAALHQLADVCIGDLTENRAVRAANLYRQGNLTFDPLRHLRRAELRQRNADSPWLPKSV